MYLLNLFIFKNGIWRPFEENIDNQSDMDNDVYPPTQSVHSLCYMDYSHNLLNSTCPPSPLDNSALEQIATKTPP